MNTKRDTIGKTRQLVFCALCIALGLVLPQAFHMVPNAGSVFLPMHIPVLLCGFLCSWPLALACGVLTPLLSHLITGMPPAFILPGMLCELAVYGLVAGLLYRFVRTSKPVVDIYLTLVGAMLAGRIVSGFMNSFVFGTGADSINAWLVSMFVTALPGIVLQLIVIPLLVKGLQLGGVLPKR